VADMLHMFYTETVIPEFPSGVVVVSFLMAALLAGVIIYKRKQPKG